MVTRYGPAVRGPSTLLGLGPCTPYSTDQKVIYAAYHLLHDSHERVTFRTSLTSSSRSNIPRSNSAEPAWPILASRSVCRRSIFELPVDWWLFCNHSLLSQPRFYACQKRFGGELGQAKCGPRTVYSSHISLQHRPMETSDLLRFHPSLCHGRPHEGRADKIYKVIKPVRETRCIYPGHMRNSQPRF